MHVFLIHVKIMQPVSTCLQTTLVCVQPETIVSLVSPVLLVLLLFQQSSHSVSY